MCRLACANRPDDRRCGVRAGVRGARAQAGGFSLAELVVVVAIIAIGAAVALPATSSVSDQQLALAARELADAYRHARDEARRTGVMHGVSVESGGAVAHVFRLDRSVSPPDPVYDVLHPLTRQAYTLTFGGSAAAGVRVGSAERDTFESCGNAKSIAFDRHGAVRCIAPLTTRFSAVRIPVGAAGRKVVVSVDGYSGKVTVK